MCEKRFFRSRKEARKYIKVKLKRFSKKYRAYKCDVCDGFHLTSCSYKDAMFFRGPNFKVNNGDL